MPPFFSKVFARGKEKEKEKGKNGVGALKGPSSPSAKQANKRFSRASVQSLLEGKFEAVSPSVSPTAEKYGEIDQTPKKEKEKEKSSGGVGLFRPKSRSASGGDTSKKQEDAPKLKLDLNLASPKLDSKRRNLSIVYEGDAVLDDEALGAKRLSPADALKLIRSCSTVLTSRGLETLGVMHPHWHSASPGAQRRIISLFLSSLTAPSEPSSASSVDSELEYARSPHDVAAVFRWALRHLKLEGDAFDKDNTPSLAWYDTFVEKEKAGEYPRTAYSDLLLPVVKPSHAELLDATLSLVSRLSSHSEWNGISGSKLSMFFGHYLLTGNRVDNVEDWLSFYSRWEHTGRALEHIFLSSLRDEDAKTGIPKRLLELVVNYPYSKSIPDNQSPRPTRFATRSYDALYVRVTGGTPPGKRSREEVYLPLQVVETAFKSNIAGDLNDQELVALWDEIRKSAGPSSEEEGSTENRPSEKSYGNVFSDESIRLLSLKSDNSDKSTPTISTFTPVADHDTSFGTPMANGRAKATNGSSSVSRQASEATTSSPIASDWNVFSSAGFGESTAPQSLAATLLDSDVEKTEPPKLSPRRSLKKSRSPGRASRAEKTEQPSSPADAPIRFKTSHVSLVKIDEAFIDFWSDALLDPISDTWPNFVVCQLKSDAVHTHGDRKVTWLVIEKKLVAPSLPPPPSPGRRASSPRPSIRSNGESRPSVVSRVSATFSPRKRFNFFGGGSTHTLPASTVSGSEKRDSKAIPKGAKVNELGEIILEEKEKPSPPTPKEERAKSAPAVPEKPKGDVAKEDAKKPSEAVVAGTAAVAVGTASATAATLASEEAKPEVPAKDAKVKEPVKEEPVEAPAKAAEPELPTPPVPEKPAAEAPGAPPAVEQVQVEESQVAAPVTSQAEAAKVQEPVKPAEPEPQPEPEVLPPANAGEPTAPPPAEAPPPPEDSASSPATGAKSGEVEEDAAGASRFVEHIEAAPPPDEKAATVEEPAPEDKAAVDASAPATVEALAPEEKGAPVLGEPGSVIPEAVKESKAEEPASARVPAVGANDKVEEVEEVEELAEPVEADEAPAPAVIKPTAVAVSPDSKPADRAEETVEAVPPKSAGATATPEIPEAKAEEDAEAKAA